MEKMENFLFPLDKLIELESLPDDDYASLLKALIRVSNGDEPIVEKQTIKYLFNILKLEIETMLLKSNIVSEKRKEAAQKSHEKRRENQNKNLQKQKEQNKAKIANANFATFCNRNNIIEYIIEDNSNTPLKPAAPSAPSSPAAPLASPEDDQPAPLNYSPNPPEPPAGGASAALRNFNSPHSDSDLASSSDSDRNIENNDLDLSPRLWQGKKNAAKNDKDFIPPTLEEVMAYALETHSCVDPQEFIDQYTATNWCSGNSQIYDWKSMFNAWQKREAKKMLYQEFDNPEWEENRQLLLDYVKNKEFDKIKINLRCDSVFEEMYLKYFKEYVEQKEAQWEAM